MLASQIPTKFQIPFAKNAAAGTIRQVPVADQTATSPGAASLTTGFPVATGQPLASGGIPPAMQDFNGILNQDTAWAWWQAAGGTVQFDQTFCTAVGGYPAGAILASTTLGKIWLSTVDNNLTNPDSGGAAGWLGLSPAAAKTYFNVQRLLTTTRVSMSSSTAGSFQTGASGLSYTKMSSTSRLIVQCNFTVYSPVVVGSGNTAVTQRLVVGSGYDEAGVTSGFQLPGGSNPPFTPASNPIFFIDGLAAGALSISLLFKRDDNLTWTSVFNPTSADVSGLPATNTAKFIISEVEP